MSTVLDWVFHVRKWRVARLSLLAAAVMSASVLLLLMGTSLGDRLEGWTIDRRFESRGPLTAPSDVVVVGIDDTSAQWLDSWPPPQESWASAIQSLGALGTRAVAVDIDFSTPLSAHDPKNPAAGKSRDQLVIEAAKKHGPVVFGSREDESGKPGAPLGGLLGGPEAIDANDGVYDGVSTDDVDKDGIVRRYQTRHGDRDSLALAAAAESGIIDEKALKDVPDRFILNWYGGPGAFTYVSFLSTPAGVWTAQDVGGSISVIGAYNGTKTDNRRTPISGAMPSPELQATAVANIIDQSWLRLPPDWIMWTIAVSMALLIWVMQHALRPLFAIMLSGIIIGGYIVLAQSWFDAGVVVPMTIPILVAILMLAACVSSIMFDTVRQRLRAKGMFARYVSPEVVAELLDGDDSIQLGGEEREITVLFSDIRGFTSMSEHADAAELVSQLNNYFGEMVQVVTRHQGTLDKFLGDGLMAIFGAPLDTPDHASKACDAAAEMLAKLNDINSGRAIKGQAPLRVGIGIHTGVAIVGNIGSPLFRVDFTAIGDTVNLAARLETATKDVGADILVSDATMTAAGEHHTFRPKGSIVVKGREQATSVFELT